MTDGVLPRIPSREPGVHKGDFGHMIVVAGSVGMTGAAGLTAEAAVRSGAGLVTLLCPGACWMPLAAQMREAMVRPVGGERAAGWSEDCLKEVMDFAGGRSGAVVAVGPGMGRSEEAAAFARRLALELALPMVIDADALVAFQGRAESLAKRSAATVLTPHPGEARRLIGDFNVHDEPARRGAAEKLARLARAVVVLKGHGTVITDGERTAVNRTGNPGMATGGTGDVLTGVIAGLMTMGLSAFDAARLGAHIHGLAGDLAATEKGEVSLAASDMLGQLPSAFCRVAGEDRD